MESIETGSPKQKTEWLLKYARGSRELSTAFAWGSVPTGFAQVIVVDYGELETAYVCDSEVVLEELTDRADARIGRAPKRFVIVPFSQLKALNGTALQNLVEALRPSAETDEGA